MSEPLPPTLPPALSPALSPAIPPAPASSFEAPVAASVDSPEGATASIPTVGDAPVQQHAQDNRGSTDNRASRGHRRGGRDRNRGNRDNPHAPNNPTTATTAHNPDAAAPVLTLGQEGNAPAPHHNPQHHDPRDPRDPRQGHRRDGRNDGRNHGRNRNGNRDGNNPGGDPPHPNAPRDPRGEQRANRRSDPRNDGRNKNRNAHLQHPARPPGGAPGAQGAHRNDPNAPLLNLTQQQAAHRDAIHRSLLTGLLGNVGKKLDAHDYQGARGIKFNLFPGSSLFRSKPQWVVSAELVETTKLYARTSAPINPEWLEHIAPHLLSPSYGDPYWDRAAVRAMVKMKLSFHGLPVVPARVLPFGKVDVKGARNLFIHHALVEAEVDHLPPFLQHNLDLRREIQALEDKARRRDLLADAARLFFFYDTRIPDDITDGPTFLKWFNRTERTDPKLLRMTREDLLAADASDITPERYPDAYLLPSGMKLDLHYRYDPAHPADGVTAIVPVEALAGLHAWQFDRLVPGMLLEKVDALIRSLPKELRVRFVPVPPTAAAALPHVAKPEGLLTDKLAAFLQVPADAFNPAELPPHLTFNFRVVDQHKKVLAAGRDLAALRKELGIKTRSVFADLPTGPWNRDGLKNWDFDALPAKVDITIHGITMPAYPALIDRGDTVALKLLESPEAAYDATRGGLRRLFALQLASEINYLEKHLPNFEKMSLHYRSAMIAFGGTATDLKADLLAAASERALVTEPEQIRTKQQFIAHAAEGWKRIVPAAGDIAALATQVLESRHRIDALILNKTFPELLRPSVRDIQDQLAALMPKLFLSQTPQQWLPHLPRFFKTMEVRLNKLLNAGAARDIEGLKVIRPLWAQYVARAKAHADQGIRDPELTTFRWMLEELRVSLFAQELKTSIPISPQRLERQWEKVRAAK